MSLRDDLRDWFAERMPDGWLDGPPDVLLDGDEILVVLPLPEPELEPGTPDGVADAARAATVRRFREETRERRVEVASEAEHRFGRKVSWGARCGDARQLFTSLAVPVMTRLRLPERSLLDTLVDGGVARSRSEALAWCVRLVATHESDWLADLEDALGAVRRVRTEGPRTV